MARMVSTSNIILRARRAADMENSTFVGSQEVLDHVNDAVPELHDVLISAYGEDYFHKITAPAAFTVNLASYALPADFYKLVGVDIETQPSNDLWLPVRRFGERERNLGQGGLPTYIDFLKYRVRGQNVVFAPPPSTTSRYRFQYMPPAPVLLNTSVLEADVSAAADTITLADHRMTDEHPLRFSVVSGSVLPTGLVANTTYYAIVVDANTFKAALTPSGTAIDLTDDGTGTIKIESMFDGVNGWERLIVLSVAIQLLAKEESDVAPLTDERARLERRLDAMVDNRDAGEPETIQDVMGDLPGQIIGGRFPPPL